MQKSVRAGDGEEKAAGRAFYCNICDLAEGWSPSLCLKVWPLSARTKPSGWRLWPWDGPHQLRGLSAGCTSSRKRLVGAYWCPVGYWTRVSLASRKHKQLLTHPKLGAPPLRGPGAGTPCSAWLPPPQTSPLVSRYALERLSGETGGTAYNNDPCHRPKY